MTVSEQPPLDVWWELLSILLLVVVIVGCVLALALGLDWLIAHSLSALHLP